MQKRLNKGNINSYYLKSSFIIDQNRLSSLLIVWLITTDCCIYDIYSIKGISSNFHLDLNTFALIWSWRISEEVLSYFFLPQFCLFDYWVELGLWLGCGGVIFSVWNIELWNVILSDLWACSAGQFREPVSGATPSAGGIYETVKVDCH